jgi:hypothetical protein
MRARLLLRLWLWSKAVERRCWAWAVDHDCVCDWVRVSMERSARGVVWLPEKRE